MAKKFGLRVSGILVLGCCAARLTAPAMAQDSVSSQDSSIQSGADIIVTAQRREQSLQDVPVAVSAIGKDQLAARQISNVTQLSGLAPNLTITTSPTSSVGIQVALRGSVTTNPSVVYDPAVGLYMDGVYVGKGFGAVFDIGDLERVEVLRGPQGTLFGRNTLAGAVSFVTRKPSDTLRIEGEATYGNYDYMAMRALVNVPLTDRLFVKGAVQIQRRDGFVRSVADPYGLFPAPTGEQDDRNRTSALVQVRWKPTDRLTLDYSYDYSDVDEHPMTALYSIGAGNIFDPASPVYSGLPLYLYVQPTDKRPKEISNDIISSEKSRVQGHSLIAEYALDGLSVKSITAHRRNKVTGAPLKFDSDGSPIPIVLGGYGTDFKQFSQELQVTGVAFDDRLNYVLGGYYLKDNGQSPNPQSYFYGSNAFETSFGIRTRAFATYGQADYKLTDRLTLTGGLRWTSEHKQLNRFYQILALSPNPGLPLPFTVIDIGRADNVRHTFSNVSPTAILAYAFNRDLNVYARYAVGFRSGSYNGEATTDPDARTYFAPEKNRSYELGIKSRMFDRRLQLNIAAFYMDQVDKQVPVFVAAGTAATINRNAGGARVYGLEVEIDARPVDQFHLWGSLGLLRAKYRQYLDIDTGGNLVDVADNRFFPKSPRTTASAGADLTLYKAASTVTLSGDVLYQGRNYSLPGQIAYDPAFPLVGASTDLALPSSTLVNARLRWDDIPLSGNLRGYAMLWAKNLTNFVKPNNKISFGPNFGGIVTANYYEPRTYGLTLGFSY
jgi:iron complex outermembrane receptor protein